MKSKMLNVDGLMVEYTTKNVKNVNLRIRPDGTIAVSAPRGVPEREVARFVRLKRPWIEDRLAIQSASEAIPVRQWESGEDVLLFGKKYRLVVFDDRSSLTKVVTPIRPRSKYAVGIHGETLVLVAPNSSTPKQRDQAMRQWYREVLEAEVTRMVTFWEERTGLYSSGFRIRDMKSRWGSCKSGTHELCFNLQLVLYDRRLLEYVVLHELAHIEEPNHSAAFWGIVEEYMPDWKARRRALRDVHPPYRSAE